MVWMFHKKTLKFLKKDKAFSKTPKSFMSILIEVVD